MRSAKAVLGWALISLTMARYGWYGQYRVLCLVPCCSGMLTVNVVALVLADLADLELSVGGLGSAVTAGQVVDDKSEDVCAGDIFEGGLDLGNVRDGITL